MWRPENWDTEKPQKFTIRRVGSAATTPSEFYQDVEFAAFNSGVEAGADAMLKAIWKMAEESPTKTFTFDKNHFHVYREE